MLSVSMPVRPVVAAVRACLGPERVPVWEWAPCVTARRQLEVSRIGAGLRALLDELAAGEVRAVRGAAVMDAPCGEPGAELLEAGPALVAWADLMAAIVPDLPCSALRRVAALLVLDAPVWPGLVVAARAEVEGVLAALPYVPAERVRAGRQVAEIRWAVADLGLGGEEAQR